MIYLGLRKAELPINGEVKGLGLGKWGKNDRELECLMIGDLNGHQWES